MINNFYWGGDADARKLNWIRWDSLATTKSFGGLGFRSFHDFNIAMLGKQWWRLRCRGESLMAKVIKARYYPKSELGEAKRGTNSSFLWKSLYAVRDMINKGSMWKIGDGNSVEIWGDCWVPNNHSGKIQTLRGAGQDIRKVCQLIDPNSKSWNEPLIRSIFIPMDVGKILQIPLPATPTRDKIIWKDSVNGQYSVKSGYKILHNQKTGQGEAGSSNSRGSRLWKKIWAIEVLPSCKEFIWRACKEVLPVYANLKRRGIELETTCQACGEEEETIVHAILTCSRTHRFWFGSHLSIQVPQSLNNNFRGWIESLFEHANPEAMAGVFNLAWTIWKRRNSWVFEAKHWDFEQTMSKVAAIQLEREKRNDSFSQDISPTSWKPLGSGEYELNVDAANQQGGTGFGAIIRNERGETLAAATRLWRAQDDSTMAEALGVKWALEWARQIGYTHLVLETDSLILEQQWRNNSLGDSYLHDVIRSCRNMSTSFRSFSVSHVKRSGNRVADFLSRLAFNYHDQCWIEEDPPGLPF